MQLVRHLPEVVAEERATVGDDAAREAVVAVPVGEGDLCNIFRKRIGVNVSKPHVRASAVSHSENKP